MTKKWNWTLTIFAIVNVVCYVAIFVLLESLNQGLAAIGMIIIPLYILIFSAIVFIFCIIHRKNWFAKPLRASSILMLFFCAPLPLIGFSVYAQSVLRNSEFSGFESAELNLKTEEEIADGQTTAIRYWEYDDVTKEYLKDSTWVYFDQIGDTSRIEVYHLDSLLFERDFQID